MIMITRTYSELIEIPTFEERFQYLSLQGVVGADTFGHDRYLNQILYNSPEWKRIRRKVIIRDNGCDLACTGFEIAGPILIHHINPITVEDIVERSSAVFDLNNLITTVLRTHNAIHYGDESLLNVSQFKERSIGDTCPWWQ